MIIMIQLRFCKAHVTQNVMQGDALTCFDHGNGGYDLIVAFNFLRHVFKSQVLIFLAKLYGCLNSNEMFLLRVPNMTNPFSINSFYRDFTHATGYTETSLYQILSTTGSKKIPIFSSAPFQNTIRIKLEFNY